MPRKRSSASGNKKKNEPDLPEIPVQENFVPAPTRRRPGATTLVLAVLVLASLAAVLYFWNQNRRAKENSRASNQKETQELVTAVGKLMELPKEEEPTLATVTDKDKVKDQSFFKEAQNGDKVLIYIKSEKAILYRPDSNKIINVSSVYKEKPASDQITSGNEPKVNGENTAPESEAPPNDAEPQKTFRIALYNGTGTTGLTVKAEERLKEAIESIDVVKRENAQKKDYEKSLVADISGDCGDQAQAVARLFSAEVGELPNGEEVPDADIVVILGKIN